MLELHHVLYYNYIILLQPQNWGPSGIEQTMSSREHLL